MDLWNGDCGNSTTLPMNCSFLLLGMNTGPQASYAHSLLNLPSWSWHIFQSGYNSQILKVCPQISM